MILSFFPWMIRAGPSNSESAAALLKGLRNKTGGAKCRHAIGLRLRNGEIQRDGVEFFPEREVTNHRRPHR